MNIENIPDYPALQQLSRALWREGTARGAALFVGAGFSKNAERPAADTPPPPLWTDFADSMAKQLYPLTETKVQRDPLRLAEEYKAYFGRAALDELIRTRILDAAWQPGPLHRELLSLEWSDVLTTNWDTLLERAAETVSDRTYEIVRSESDLAHTRSPRIVKLHGSLGASEHFTLTEEDYRTYPTTFAAFVNFARQTFIENELCLVGFSGDDPNFLQWSGWVRDNLGGSARRIYLVGVLDMAPSKRKLLESRNVAPIDLGPLVKDLPGLSRHEVATRAFIQFLACSKPKALHDWRPISLEHYDFLPKTVEDQQRLRDPAYGASLLDQAAKIWTRDRMTYPGWLVCPSSIRNDIDHLTNICRINESAVNALPIDRKAEVLYEIAWRKEISLAKIDKNIASQLESIAYPNQISCLTQRQSIEVAILLMKAARRSGDKVAFLAFAESLSAHAEQGTDLQAEIAYQRALNARDSMDFSVMKAETDMVTGQDPIWLLRRASLLVEAGEANSAAKLVFDAQAELEKRQRRNQTSLWVKSRRAWAEWIARATRLNQDFAFRESRWPLEFKGANCDPGDEINQLTNAFSSELRKLREEKSSSIPPFQAGHYRIQSTEPRKHVQTNSEHLETLNQLMEIVGLPMRLDYVTLATSAALDAAQMSFDGTARWYSWVLRALDVPWGGIFERYFSRVEIACLSTETITTLTHSIKTAISYWSSRMDSDPKTRGAANGHLRLLIEVLARLTVRQTPGVARSHLKLAENIGQQLWANHPWLNEALNNLLENSIAALPPAGQQDTVLSLLSFPLSQESSRFSHFWPEPTDYLWNVRVDRSQDQGWDSLISKLIEAANPSSNQRPSAVIRLSYLFRNKVLNAAETENFGRALWAEIDQASGLPSKTIMLAYMFAELPAPDGIDKNELVAKYLFGADINEIFSVPATLDTRDIGAKTNRLQGIASAVPGLVRPTREQAVGLFDSIIKWRMPDLSSLHPLNASFLNPLHGKSGRYLGDILRMIASALNQDDITPERARAIITFVSEVEASTAIAALPYFVSDDETLNIEIIRVIHRAIVGRTAEEVAGAAWAVELWASDQFRAQGKCLPSQLIDRIVASIETGRATGLLSVLSCAHRLIEARILSEEEMSRLAYALGELLAQYQYQRIDPESQQAIVASLVRAGCVKIAHGLKETDFAHDSVTAWLAEAENDPLPEVRFALELEALQEP